MSGKPPALFITGPHGPARDAGIGEALAVERMVAISPEFAAQVRVMKVDCRPFMRRGSWMFPRDQVCALAAWGAGFDGVGIAWVREDGTTLEHIEASAKAIRGAIPAQHPFVVEFPVWEMTKAELITEALRCGCPPEFIIASHSCVRQSDGHCGECTNCKQRSSAFREAGVTVG